MGIPVEPGFRDGEMIFWWRVEWDEECFCHVEAANEIEATEKAIALMSRGRPVGSIIPPESVARVNEWIVVGKKP